MHSWPMRLRLEGSLVFAKFSCQLIVRDVCLADDDDGCLVIISVIISTLF